VETFITRLHERLAPQGFNVIGAADVARYDAAVPPRHAVGTRVPDARTVVVIGNGGAALWEVFRRHCEDDPSAARQPEPLDAFTRSVVMDAVGSPGLDLGEPPRVAFPFEDEPLALSFVHLAECAGLGRRSLVGVLVHPEFGPWFALRAALLLPFALDAPRPADGFDPCPGCVERPCIAACPGGAVGPGGWDVPRCAGHRLSGVGDGCDAGCHARIACVLAPEHRYPPEALAFHQTAARAAMAARSR
jgi:hypothetical protein